jgi:hypothetical protein
MATFVANRVSSGDIWSGDFQTRNLTQWTSNQSASAVRVQILTDTPPPGYGQYARLLTYDTDVYPLTPTDNPRSQLVGPNTLWEGRQLQISWWTRIPSAVGSLSYTLPTWSSGFWEFFELWGWPYYGSPGVEFQIHHSNDVIQLNRSPYPFQSGDTPWTAPLVTDTWLCFRLRASVSSDINVGWLELDYANDGTANVVSQSLSGQTRLPTKVLHDGTVRGAAVYQNNYRSLGLANLTVIDHAGMRVTSLS